MFVCRSPVFKLFILLLIIVLITYSDAKRKKNKKFGKNASNKMILRQKETNAVDFIRLAVMRLIYGIASRFGLGEQISGALNGAFVPPGVDPEYSDYGDDDGGFGLLDRDEDDDYDY
ncbi:uncharacterized protein [Atheta coriaria]|uniref:uncharacterized protein n=1 Tax=Dalotia coriaria TaxID=877792 RepID=UPI0031F46B12